MRNVRLVRELVLVLMSRWLRRFSTSEPELLEFQKRFRSLVVPLIALPFDSICRISV